MCWRLQNRSNFLGSPLLETPASLLESSSFALPSFKMFDKVTGDKTSHWSVVDKSTHVHNSTIVDKTHETLMKISAESSVFLIVIIGMLSLLAAFALLSFCCGPEIPTMIFSRLFKSIGSGISFFAKALVSVLISLFSLFRRRPRQSSDEHSDPTHEEPVSPRSIATFGTVPDSDQTHEEHSDKSADQPESVRSSALLSVRESLQRRQTQ